MVTLHRAHIHSEGSTGTLVDVGPDRPERRVVHLEVLADQPAGDQEPVIRSARAAAERRTWSSDDWLRIAERGLGHWASTLRTAFLMLVGMAGVIVLIGLAFGFQGAVLGTIIGVILYLVAVGRPAR